MKISKSILQAIFAGVTLGAAAVSCTSVKEEVSAVHFNTCDQNCDIDHATERAGESNNVSIPNQCPDCGRG